MSTATLSTTPCALIAERQRHATSGTAAALAPASSPARRLSALHTGARVASPHVSPCGRVGRDRCRARAAEHPLAGISWKRVAREAAQEGAAVPRQHGQTPPVR